MRALSSSVVIGVAAHCGEHLVVAVRREELRAPDHHVHEAAAPVL